MPLNPYFDGLDNLANAGKFFVDLTERLGDGELNSGEDVKRLSRTLGVAMPPELVGASIISLENGKGAELRTERRGEGTTPRIVIEYPLVSKPEPGQVERKFSRCFQTCKTVGGAKICSEVCVEIDISLSGIGGKIKATVSVSF